MYFDPGAGSLVLQAILTAILAIGMFIKMNWYRIKLFFSRNSQDKESGHNVTEHKED